ncbi:hypothetical protein Q7P37_006995 [Cladosporium fusiforme]
MKIIIVGAGLSGLSTALSLYKYVQPILSAKNEPLEITVYDEADAVPAATVEHGNHDHTAIRTKNQGAAISLQPNAFKVLRDLDPRLAERVYAAGFPCNGFTWKSAGDWTLGREDLRAHIISRPVLVECLQEALPEQTVVYRSVSEVRTSTSGKPVVVFSDGGTEEGDLVVGADGIRSPVRKSLFGEKEEYRPVYLGHCVVGGVLELQQNPFPQSYLDDPRVVFAHGPTGTFGYCGLSQAEPNKVLYFSFFDSDLPPRGQKLDFQRLTAETRERHRGWKDPFLVQSLNEAVVDNFYPIFYLPDLPHWGRDRCVLVGDAAHVMTPASGQGGSQAFEDGLTLALLLAEFLQSDEKEAVQKTIQGLFDTRSKHVYKIKADGLAMKEPERPWGWLTTTGIYAFFFAMTKVKWLASFFGQTVYPAHVWDAKEEVAKYVATSGT